MTTVGPRPGPQGTGFGRGPDRPTDRGLDLATDRGIDPGRGSGRGSGRGFDALSDTARLPRIGPRPPAPPTPEPAPAGQRQPRSAEPAVASRPTIAGHPWHLTLLAGLAFGLHIWLYRNGGYSWHYFADGASLLFGQHPPGEAAPGGLHLYANYPQLQFGPVALLTAALVRPFADDGGWMVATGLMTLAGVLVLHLLEQIVYRVRPDLRAKPVAMRCTMLVGGGSFLLSWELLAVHFGHLDDVLALVFITGALAAAVSRRPVIAGLCVGLATDAKPWALVCVALLLMFNWK
jgi:hypothetical protein